MSLSRVISTGSGKLEFRLMIEGLGYEAVSHADMETARPQVRGESGWSTSNYYSHADGVLEGSGTGMTRVVAFRLDASAASAQYIFAKGTGAGGGGWAFSASGLTLTWRASNGAAVNAQHVFGAADVGKAHVLVGTLDGANMRLYVNGTLVATTAWTGTFAPNASATNLGARDGGTDPATSFTIIGAAASDTVVLSAADVAEHFRDSKQLGDVAPYSGLEHLYSRKSGDMRTDQVGTLDLTRVGSPTDTGLFTAAYATDDGRQRVHSLQRDGLSREESSHPVTAEIEASGMTATIVDRQRDDAWTTAFASAATLSTHLTADLAVADTTISVVSTAGISAGDVVHVGTEAILVGTVASATSLTGCTRAYWDTIAQKHWTESGERLAFAELTDRPVSIEGRRAYLYVYGDADDLQGDGTLEWRGVCLTDARLNEDGSSWSVTIDPITTLFDQSLGSDLDEPTEPRGIYYPANWPLAFRLREYSSDSRVALSGSAAGGAVVGHYETQEDFCAALTAKLATATTAMSANSTLRAVSEGPSGWRLEVTTGATARYMWVALFSPVDYSAAGPDLLDADGAPVTTVAAATTYTVPIGAGTEGASTAPRGVYGDVGLLGGYRHTGRDEHVTDAERAAYPENRVYLGGRATVGGLTGVRLEPTGADLGDDDSMGVRILDQDADDRYIDTRASSGAFVYTRELALGISFQRFYISGTLADFRDTITALALTESNKGTVPFVTTEDWADITDVVNDAESGRGFALRRYMAAASVNLMEMLREEAKLRGCFWRLDAAGKLDLVRLGVPVATSAFSGEIGDDEVLIDRGYPTWEKNGQGQVNVVRVKTGYNPVEDEHQGREFVVREVRSISRTKKNRELEIAPLSGLASAGTPADYEDIVSLVMPLLGVYGGDYAIVTVEVPFTKWNLLVGSFVSLTIPQIPDPSTGRRGMEAQPGIVLSRRKDYDQGRIQMTVLTSFDRVAGYAPSVRVSGATDQGGDKWSLGIETTDISGYDLLEPGATGDDHFPVGARILLREWGSASPTKVTGTVLVAGGAEVQLDSSWAGMSGSDIYYLGYADAADAALIAAQKRYAYLAGATGKIAFASGDVEGRVYAP